LAASALCVDTIGSSFRRRENGSSFIAHRLFKEDWVIIMLGMLFDEKECRELNYLLRREMDEMLLDLNDSRMDGQIKEAIISRYKVIFRMYARLATPKELSRYAPGRNIR
jgi:hypothetical protein